VFLELRQDELPFRTCLLVAWLSMRLYVASAFL